MKAGTRTDRSRSIGIAWAMMAANVLGFNQAIASGIPVVDAAAIAQDKINQVERIAKAVEQINQLKAQIERMKQQYQSMTGSRGLGEIAQDPALRNYLPPDWREVYDGVAAGGYKGLTGSSLATRNASLVFDACARLGDQRRTQCERASSKAAIDKALAIEAYDKATARWDQISLLMKSINRTTDPKSIAELQARIEAEQAALQNEQTKLDMYRLVADAEARLIEQQRNEQNAKTWGAQGRGVSAKPLKFGAR